MIILALALVVSLAPALLLYWWLRNRVNDEDAYKRVCSSALKNGVLCIFPVMLFSAIFHIIIRLTGIRETNPLLYAGLYKFIVLALSEEIVKYLMFRRTLKKTEYQVSWLDAAVLMPIIGIGFDLIESIVYAIGANVPTILVRGICIPHAGLGFIVGYFYSKGLKNGNPATKWIGLVLAWLIHGLYDFSLSKEFLTLNDNLAIIPFTIAVLDIVLVILLIRFVRKRKEEIL